MLAEKVSQTNFEQSALIRSEEAHTAPFGGSAYRASPMLARLMIMALITRAADRIEAPLI
jgi:hypothetical protein